MDDLINNDICSSSSSSTASEHIEPSSSLHNLPAWSTSEEGDEWSGSSPVNSDGAAGDGAAISDVWFAPSSLSSRKKRSSIKKITLLADRQASPGAASANLKSHKSAPQLVKKRVASVDHQAKLQDLLVEMGWPRESSRATAEEAVDGGDYHTSNTSSNQQNSSAASSYSNNAGAGSLASGMPVTSALFQRRAANNKEGDMPAPSQVVVPASEDAYSQALNNASNAGSAMFLSDANEMAHSRSATFPLSYQMDSAVAPRPGPVTSMSSSYLTTMGALRGAAPNAAFTSQHNEAAKKQQQFQEALYYGLNSATRQTTPLLLESPYVGKTPDTGSTASAASLELQTPVTPFQSLSTSDMSGPYSYTVSPVNSVSSQLLPGYSYPVKASKTPADLDVTGAFGNSLGLNFLPAMNQRQQQQQQQHPAMIDSSSYAQIFAGMNASNDQQQQPSTLKQMRSSPNMRVSASSEGSPIKSPIRKIASNRRLTVSTPDNSSLTNNSMSPPVKTPIKKGKSPKVASFAMPPTHHGSFMPMPSPSNIQSAALAPSSSSSSSFEFVNYGIEDADELCSAVAPSGSYKVPLKGFGGSQYDDQDEDGEDDVGADQDDDEGEKKLHRSRSKSSSRLGPRWQGMNHEEQASLSVAAMEKALRQVKRRKSEASMMLSSQAKKKASMGNLRKKD